MSVVIVGIVIGVICGSLMTAAYLGLCLKEQEQDSRSWIDSAIERAFTAVEDSLLEELPPRI
ncbi:MAG: hypothetical protein J4N65_03060 [Chloroflexi bacterium]|nr:hypothetical protein [Chloroflexota bacterium]